MPEDRGSAGKSRNPGIPITPSRFLFPVPFPCLVPVCGAFLLILVFFLSCSQAAPEISRGALELVYYENGGNPVERFSFFVLPRDDDGFEDLEELWLYHDWEGLSWRLASKDWLKTTVEGADWIGSRAIAMEDGSPLPRGL
ncbi:MAG: hypothetical protein LBD09_03150, partial [Treponema sp.]|nr:hypothetical protein [Treponema sp.]